MDPLTLLNPQDPNPVLKSLGRSAEGPFVLVGDHAGVAIPAALGDLGVSAHDRARHIALDIGIEVLGLTLAERLGAPFVHQAYSRLVVDCNRDPDEAAWIVEESGGTPIPGNFGLSPAEREARRREIFEPYHRAIADLLDRRAATGQETVLVALHSFTPAMGGERRPWELGVLHNKHEDDFALAVLAELRDRPGLTVGNNQPYRMDGTDYTVPHHAFPRGLRYAEIEVRQDLLGTPKEIERIATQLAEVLPAALRSVNPK